MKTSYTSLILVICISLISSCNDKKYDLPSDMFSTVISLEEISSNFNADSIGVIEGIQCNDTCLVIFDYTAGNSFSLFNLKDGSSKGRFGEIGQGPNEVMLGCYGHLENNYFYIYYDVTGFIAKYDINSLLNDINTKYITLNKTVLPDAMLSRITPLNDTIFLGAGVYNSEYQYCLYDNKNKVLDYDMEIFNNKDTDFNKYNKFLCNQGFLRKQIGENKFVYSIRNSFNIDFFEISKNKIDIIKSYRFKSPRHRILQTGTYNQVIAEVDNYIGYLDISSTSKYVYALISEKKIREDNGEFNKNNSKTVLVYDWAGKPVKKYILPRDTYHITVNEKSNKMFTAVKGADSGWEIATYNIE